MTIKDGMKFGTGFVIAKFFTEIGLHVFGKCVLELHKKSEEKSSND